MYTPALFREDRLDVLHEFIRSHPLGLLISSGPSGLMANLVPFHLKLRGGAAKGVLQAHLARANPQLREIDSQPVLVVFRGTHTYVSPSLYATKQESGKVVPTWNFTMVQVRGSAKVRDSGEWLTAQLHELTTEREQSRADGKLD